MSRQFIVRLILAVALLGTAAACSKLPTAPDSASKVHHDTFPWN